MLSQPLKVTFDTNTLSGVVHPDDHVAYQAVHAAVKTGKVFGFFSEVLITLDAIGRKAKAEVLGAARVVSKVATTEPNQITITLGPSWKRFDIDDRILARVESARAMGDARVDWTSALR